MNNITGSFELAFAGKYISYKLSALYDLNKDSYEMPWLSFVKDEGYVDEKLITSWDNDTFLIQILYKKVLIPWVVEKKIEDGEEFAELIKVDGVSIDDLEGLCKLMEEGFRLKLLKDKE